MERRMTETFNKSVSALPAPEHPLEYLTEDAAYAFVLEAVRHQQHSGTFDDLVVRALHAVFEIDSALATSRRLRTSSGESDK
jgi:hypothetical protein